MNLNAALKSSLLLSNPTARVVFNRSLGRIAAICATQADAESEVAAYHAAWGVTAAIVPATDFSDGADLSTRDPALDHVVVREPAPKFEDAGIANMFAKTMRALR